MDMLPAEDEDEESIVLLTESNEAQEKFNDLFASGEDPDNSLISPAFNNIDEAQKPTTGGVVSLMEVMKDAPAFISKNIDEDQEELTVVPLIEMMKDAMTIVRQIDKSYISLDTKALEIASAFSKLRPEQYATIDFMRYLLSLTDSLLDTLPQGRNSNLVVLFEHFGGNCSSTKIVTNMTVQGMDISVCQ